MMLHNFATTNEEKKRGGKHLEFRMDENGARFRSGDNDWKYSSNYTEGIQKFMPTEPESLMPS